MGNASSTSGKRDATDDETLKSALSANPTNYAGFPGDKGQYAHFGDWKEKKDAKNLINSANVAGAKDRFSDYGRFTISPDYASNVNDTNSKIGEGGAPTSGKTTKPNKVGMPSPPGTTSNLKDWLEKESQAMADANGRTLELTDWAYKTFDNVGPTDSPEASSQAPSTPSPPAPTPSTSPTPLPDNTGGGTNPNPQPSNPNPPGGPLNTPNSDHVSGNLTINGHAYKFGSGSSTTYRHIPYGTYPITPNTIGPWGQAHGAIGINGNSIYDPYLGRTRAGIEIHASQSGYTEGCIGVDPATFNSLKSEINQMIATKGSAYLTVGPNGAYIAPKGESPAAGASPASGQVNYNSPASSVTGSGAGYTDLRMADGTVQHRTGDLNWRNNNPGNIRSGSFANSQGAIGSAGGFAVFRTYQEGRQAMQNLLFNSAGYNGLTIGQAISKYAPPSENNTQNYINQVTKDLGLPANTPMSSLNEGQQQKMLDSMQNVEGFKAGSINGVPVDSSGNGYTGSGTGGNGYVAGPNGPGLYPSNAQGLNVASGAYGGGQPQPVMLSLAQFLGASIAGFAAVQSFTTPPYNQSPVPYNRGLALDFTIVNPKLADSILVTKFITGWFAENNIEAIVINYYLSTTPITSGYIHIEIPQGIPAQQALYTLDILTAFNAKLTGIVIK